MEYTTTTTDEPPIHLGTLDERAQEAVNTIKLRFAPADEWLRRMARDRPLATLAGAAGLGYLVGRLIRRV